MYVLKDILSRYELNAKKSLGQNFILDTNLLHKIARLALSGVSYSCVLEIGSGPGGLTQALLEQGVKRLVAVEKDDRCAKALTELQAEYPKNLTILNADALSFDEKTLGKGVCVVANLPYNVSTALLAKWLKNIDDFSSLTLMFQKEVADRLCAGVSCHDYGRLTILTQWLCDIEVLMILPPSVFTPSPKVTSALVRLTPKKNPFKCSFEALEKVTAAAFGQRRKMLRSSLKALGDAESLCRAAGVESTLRAEDVSVEGFCKMAAFWENQR